MDQPANELIVEFLLPPEAAGQATLKPLKLSCDCGSRQFALANELLPDIARGIPASRMYECLDCGRYRLG
jgi:hypothetical protein